MIENREAYRIPFRKKLILSDGQNIVVGNTENISANGVFVKTLQTEFRSNTAITCLFELNETSIPLRLKGVIKRVTQPSVDPALIPGLGIRFEGTYDKELKSLFDFSLEAKRKYELASTILSSGEAEIQSLFPLIEDLHLPRYLDLGELRFAVEQVLRSIELVERRNPKTNS